MLNDLLAVVVVLNDSLDESTVSMHHYVLTNQNERLSAKKYEQLNDDIIQIENY